MADIIKWDTSDNSISVDDNGLVTVPENHAGGEVKVFAYLPDTDISDEATLTIEPKVVEEANFNSVTIQPEVTITGGSSPQVVPFEFDVSPRETLANFVSTSGFDDGIILNARYDFTSPNKHGVRLNPGNLLIGERKTTVDIVVKNSIGKEFKLALNVTLVAPEG